MSTIVSRMAVWWGVRGAEAPMGTHRALLWPLWALLSGRCVRSRGALCPALAALGLPTAAGRRSGAALTERGWPVEPLLEAWDTRGQQEGRWHAPGDAGVRPVACAVVGGVRPRLSGCAGPPSQSGATNALPALGLTGGGGGRGGGQRATAAAAAAPPGRPGQGPRSRVATPRRPASGRWSVGARGAPASQRWRC